MPWKEFTTMSQRLEFVTQAVAEEANIRHLCRSYAISSATAYKWLKRFKAAGPEALEDHSRRPHHSPSRIGVEIEERIVSLRGKHPAWGGRKLRARLIALGQADVPSASTITAVLRRHQLLDPRESVKHKAFCRFQRSAPNELWQMDFKGEFQLPVGRCYPLTILDDHSRFAVALQACARNTHETTQTALIQIFRRYGLPEWITCDNGPPWGSSGRSFYTKLGVWLLRLGIGLSHSRPHHPQTQGKDERFHRTLEAEVLRYHQADSIPLWQQTFDQWRDLYNTERPHEALAMQVPSSRYQPSHRRYPEKLPPIEYGPTDIVRKVRSYGRIKFQGGEHFVGSSFHHMPVALRQTTTDGIFDVYFCQHKIANLDLRTNKIN
jgi:transposase InsO family protein